MPSPRLERVLARIDAIHAEDPQRIEVDGHARPAELLYAERMSAMLETLDAGASEALRIAVRAQHLGRFRTPRARYPEGRVGYLEWRRDQARVHAQLAGEILEAEGYEPAFVERVRFLVLKKALTTDPETQMLEDCACLVFLAHEFAAFVPTQERAKLVEIVRKTWRKMSERAHALALTVPLGEAEAAVVKEALGS